MAVDRSLVYAVAAGLLTVVFLSLVPRSTRRWPNAPPGPPTVPFLGNRYQLPRRDMHLQYQQWSEKYGDIFSLKLGSQDVVVLSSGRAIKEVIDKRSGNYADQPKLYMQEIREGSRIIIRGYDALWKVESKLYHQFLNVNKAARYIPYQDLEMKQLYNDLPSNPTDFESLVTRSTLSVATSMTYGFRVLDTKSEVMQELLTNAHGFFVMVNNSKLLDWYPQLRPIARKLPHFLNSIARKGKQIFEREKAQFLQFYCKARHESHADESRPCKQKPSFEVLGVVMFFVEHRFRSRHFNG